jgi:F0F1-type ATP synthase epsilon subunit
LRIHAGTVVSRWFLEGGFVQVRENLVTVLCERAVTFESLDADAAERQAQQAAQDGLPEARELQQRAIVMRRVLHSTSASRSH